MELKDGDQPQHGQDEGQQVQGRVADLPWQLGPRPGLRQAVQQRGCGRERPRAWSLPLTLPQTLGALTLPPNQRRGKRSHTAPPPSVSCP